MRNTSPSGAPAVTSVVRAAPEVSAPIRLEGQSNSEVLYQWLKLKGNLWMLHDRCLERLESLVGLPVAVRLLQQAGWVNLEPPGSAQVEQEFSRLEKLLQIHFFGVTTASHPIVEGDAGEGTEDGKS